MAQRAGPVAARGARHATLGLTIYLGLKHLRHQVFVYILVGAYVPVLVTEYLKDMQADPKISALGGRLGWRSPVASALLIILVNGYRIVVKDPFSLKIIPRPEFKEQHMTYYPADVLEFIIKPLPAEAGRFLDD